MKVICEWLVVSRWCIVSVVFVVLLMLIECNLGVYRLISMSGWLVVVSVLIVLGLMKLVIVIVLGVCGCIWCSMLLFGLIVSSVGMMLCLW